MLSREGRPKGAPGRNGVLFRFARLVAIALLVAVAGIVIGAASRPHSVELSFSGPLLGGVAILGLLVLGGAAGILLGYSRSPFWAAGPYPQGNGPAKSRLPWGVRAVLILMPMAFLVFLIASAGALTGGNAQRPEEPVGSPIIPYDPNSPGDNGVALLIAFIVVAITSSVVTATLFRERKPAPRPSPGAEESVAAILDEGLDALMAEHDPRRAVIAAYVAMERALARKGWARRAHEAPTEYLARVLGVAPGRAQDLGRLVGLYEMARFSEHPVSPAMRDAAVDSVRRLRAELQGPA